MLSRDSMYSSALHLRIVLQKNRVSNEYRSGTANIFFGQVNRVPRRPHNAQPTGQPPF
jgi:hypothetical protein